MTSTDSIIVTASDVRSVVSEICHLPLERLDGSQNYQALEMGLNEDLLCSSKDIRGLITLLKRREFISKNDTKPFASIMLYATCQEQTEHFLDKLAIHCFGKENSLYRLDMREYSERSAVTRLIGAPPGYEGHGDGGALTERIRRFPYSLVCFEKIDAACAEVRNIISQILTKGRITDTNSRTVSFKNTIIIITTDARSSNSIGFTESINIGGHISSKLTEDMQTDLKITLSAPNGNQIEAAISKMLVDFTRSVALSGVRLTFSNEVVSHFMDIIRNETAFGIINAKFREYIENPVIDYICSSKCNDIILYFEI